MAFSYSGLSQYFILTKAAYNQLETKSEQALYFISDTQEIYRGSVNYTNSIILVSTLPSTPLISKIYIKTSDNTINIYTGSEWITLGSLNNSISSSVAPSGTPTSLPVSGVGIKDYVEGKLNITSASDVSTTTLYNNLQLPVTITQTSGGNTYTCTFTKTLSNTSVMGCYVTYVVKQGNTTKSTNYWYPGGYNDFANSMGILTDLGTAAITKLL